MQNLTNNEIRLIAQLLGEFIGNQRQDSGGMKVATSAICKLHYKLKPPRRLGIEQIMEELQGTINYALACSQADSEDEWLVEPEDGGSFHLRYNEGMLTVSSADEINKYKLRLVLVKILKDFSEEE